MSLTLRQLEVFLAAAQDCNFRRTAQRLGVSQPSISNRIRSIEQYLGCTLFERSSGLSPRLTHEGRSFVTKAHQLLNGAARLSQPRRTESARTPLRLRIIVGQWLLRQRVMPALPGFCYEQPQIAADFLPLGIDTEARALIRTGEADICVFTGDPPEDAGQDVQIVGTTACSIFGAPELLARLDPTPEGLCAAPFILPPEHHAPGRWVRERLAAVGIIPRNIVMQPQFPDLIVQMMLQGRGLSVFYDEFLADTPLRQIGPPLQPAGRIILIGPRARRPAAAPVIEFLRKVSAPSAVAACP